MTSVLCYSAGHPNEPALHMTSRHENENFIQTELKGIELIERYKTETIIVEKQLYWSALNAR